MIDTTLFKIIEDVGLSENEAKVYVSALSLGPSTVLKIARNAEVKRTTVYSIISSLKQKGLMNIEVKGFKQLYVAESPEKLDSVIESRREFLKQQMPELMGMYNLKGGESSLKYYEGLESIKNIYNDILRDSRISDKYYIVSNIAEWYKQDRDFFQGFLEKRAKVGLKPKILLQDSKEAREHQKFSQNYNITAKILPKSTSLSTNLIITPRRVVINQLHQPILAIVIENKSIIKMHQEFFEIMWEGVNES
jgi:HTH-type transcriptional regulator, sugar sensing transcriptional regulator